MSVIPAVEQQTQKRLAEVSRSMHNCDIEEDIAKRRCSPEIDLSELEVELRRLEAQDEEEYIALYEPPHEYYDELIKEAERIEERNRILEEMDQDDFDELDRGFDIEIPQHTQRFGPGQWGTANPWASRGFAPKGW